MKGVLIIVLLVTTFTSHAKEFNQGRVITELPEVLSFRDRVEPQNNLVIDRLDNLLPKLMDEVGLDMWLVINREYGEDE